MGKIQLCYRIEELPDLSLNKYSSLDGTGVSGVLEKHMSFLRQWNRKGILSGITIHLFYCYMGKGESGGEITGKKGNKIELFFLIRGQEEKMRNVPDLVEASALSTYFKFSACDFEEFEEKYNMGEHNFSSCSTLLKKEVFIQPSTDTSGEEYYTVSQWEINEVGRLYNMLKLMESLDKRLVYRIDLYPIEKGESLRAELRRPISILRERIYSRVGQMAERDYEAENVLKEYEELLKSVDSSPHFLTNIFVFGNEVEDTAVVLDAAGAEALKRGNYEIASFEGEFSPRQFWEDEYKREYLDNKKGIILGSGRYGVSICNENACQYELNYLPTLLTLEEVSPFFRFPTLYEGEVIQRRKETAPKEEEAKSGLYLGVDDNDYEVYFPLKNLAKHVFIAGVPGSGKTNTMHHLTSTLWKKHDIPFLVLEPAKQEYRALANQKGMEELYIFSPNADMMFPLHINPFEFPRGLMVAEHIRRLESVFEGAFPLDNPMPFLLDTAIEAVYRDMGWTPETTYTEDTKLKFPTMSMLYKRLEEELRRTTYSDEVRGNLESALKVRIGSLLRREMGTVFDVPESTIPPERWLQIPAIVELEAMGTGPANFLTLMLCTLIRETLKVNPHYEKDHARHMIFIEEAHNLIGPEAEGTVAGEANPKQAATTFIVKMLAEVRALKEGIVIADQLPTVMAQEVIKNTGLKIGLKITAADDRALLGSTMSANEIQIEKMATFDIGRSLISYEGLMRPFVIQTHQWCGTWGTPFCGKQVFNIEWCMTKCDFYKEGDCIPDNSLRKCTTVSKSDVELIKLIRNRNSYKTICERNLVIESEKFSREITEFIENGQNMIVRMKLVNEKDLQIKRLEEELFYRTEVLVEDEAWESNQEEIVSIQAIAEQVNSLKMEIETEYLKSETCQKSQDIIEECIALAVRIHNKKKYWIRLGIVGFTECESEKKEEHIFVEIPDIIKNIKDMQKTSILLAQQLFIMLSPHFKDASKVRKELEKAILIFGVKNILI